MARPSKLAALSIADLNREIDRRKRGSRTLIRKRARLAAQLLALDARIAELGLATRSRGARASGAGKRHKNEMSLAGVLAQVLAGKTLGVADAADAALRAGYKSNATNFRVMVNGTLSNSDKFKRVERGQYTAA